MRIKLSVPISACDLARYLAVPVKADFRVEYVCTDSREAREGDLFIPLRGEKFNGADFISEALCKGAHIMSTGYDIEASDGNYALLKLAEYYKGLLDKLRVTVAVTGSVGKTTTREFITALLTDSARVHCNKGNENNEIGVPLTVLAAAQDTEILVLECGTNHKGELSRISKCIKPDIAVITNIGTAHIGNFGSREDIASAKLEICDGMDGGFLICEANESLLKHSRHRTTVSVGGTADFILSGIERASGGYTMCFSGGNVMIEDIFFPVDAEHLIPDFAYALAVGVLCGISPDAIRLAASGISNTCLRHRYIDCGSFTLIDDSYNASLESVKGALDMLRGRRCPTGALFGDILELGSYTEEIHREIGKYACRCGVSKLYLTGEFAQFTALGATDAGLAPSSIFISKGETPAQMAKIIECAHEPGELILVKASHRSDLSRVINILKEGKGHD